MNEESFIKAMEQAMNRATGRFVQSGFTVRHIASDKLDLGEFTWNDDGARLSRHVKHFFDVPNVHPEQILPEDIVAFVMLLLKSNPAPNSSLTT